MTCAVCCCPAIVSEWIDVHATFHMSEKWQEIMLSWSTDHMVARHLHVCLAHYCDGVQYVLETDDLSLLPFGDTCIVGDNNDEDRVESMRFASDVCTTFTEIRYASDAAFMRLLHELKYSIDMSTETHVGLWTLDFVSNQAAEQAARTIQKALQKMDMGTQNV